MAAPLPPRRSAAWRVEPSSFCGFPVWRTMQLAIYLARGLTLQDSAPHPTEGSQHQCSRQYDTLTCLLFTAQWLGQGQSILTQTQRTDDIDMGCYKTLPTKSLTCFQVGPMSLEWLVAPPGGVDQPNLPQSQEDFNDGHLENVHLAPPHLRWRRDALQLPEIQRVCLDRNTCAHTPEGGLRCITWNTRGLNGSSSTSQSSRERKHKYFSRHLKNNDILSSRNSWEGRISPGYSGIGLAISAIWHFHTG